MALLKRLLAHLCASPAARTFNAVALERIATVIAECETRHRGEIVFAVESDMPLRDVWAGVTARDHAQAAFARLNVWDTAANNGVLIYLLLAEHRIEIVADRGFDTRVSTEQWRGVCQLMEEQFAAGDPVAAVVRGVRAASELVEAHFPQVPGQHDEDELPNHPRLL